MDEGEPLPKVDVLVLPGSGSVDFDPLLSALQSPVRCPACACLPRHVSLHTRRTLGRVHVM